ncbi:DUF4405 domain-containing protein [uncultured Desulfobacter sp.]|uniref:DUF4405 domain-containing protein n=1 Tax=uncultured Desulfobacter sp. TaxID=240139 RepID=UPI002AAC283D|nr:DUF4405 domain-containing protein [uncultured Desulfobacter sp.]
MIHYRLVPGFQGGSGASFLGISRHVWGDIHFWASCLFTAALSFHLYLNFSVIKLVISGRSSRKAAALFGIGVLIVIFFLLFPVFHGQNGYGNYHRGQPPGRLFR